MTDLTPERRAQLAAKYGVGKPPMPPMVNTQARAVVRADTIVRRVWGDFALADEALFDRVRVPAMAARADAAAEDYRRRAADGRLRYDTADTDYNPDCPSEQGVVRIWPVGTNHVHVVRERWRDSPTRKLTTADWAATSLRNSVDLADWFDCAKFGCDSHGCLPGCDVRLSPGCSGTTRLLPVHRGTLILLFRCCWACADDAERRAGAALRGA